LQRSVDQLRSDICQTHHILWNDGVNRTNKNQLKLDLNDIGRLFECVFYEERKEKLLMEKNIQTFAMYCLQGFINVLIEKKLKLDVDVQTTMVLITMDNEEEEELDRNEIEQFNETLNYLKKFFEVLDMHLLTRVMKVQTANEK
jgi:hypothetical protein